MPIIECINLSYTYHRDTPLAKGALKDISLTVNRGEFIAIVGATGSGKSTLVQHFNGLLKPQQGTLKVFGQDCYTKSVRNELWRRVGLVFQYPDHQLFAETVYQEIAYGLHNLGIPPAEIRQRVTTAITQVGLGEAILSHSPLTLSGGQKRKVALASTLAMQPDILILDEPTAGLEPVAKEKVLQLLKELQRQTETTVLMVTHSLEEAAVTDRILVLHQGKLLLDGRPRHVFARREELKSLNLAVPVEVEVLQRLHQLGVPVSTDLVGIHPAVEQIIKVYRQRAKGD